MIQHKKKIKIPHNYKSNKKNFYGKVKNIHACTYVHVVIFSNSKGKRSLQCILKNKKIEVL
jgi:hypothetical protein